MPTTPLWQAAQDGLPGHLDATNQAAQVNQGLGTHAIGVVHEGVQVLTPFGGTQFEWLTYGDTSDFDQPFTLAGTSIGRVVIPVCPTGAGSDLQVTLYPDNGSGLPVTTSPIASTTVTAAQINAVAAPNGLADGGPLATSLNNGAYGTGSIIETTPWAPPSSGPNGSASEASFASDGSYMITVAGFDQSTSGPVASVNTIEYLGGGAVALPTPQPALPLALGFTALTVAGSYLVVMGGDTGSAVVANSWVASWDNNTGSIGSWSAQTAIPVALAQAGAASWGGSTVYLIGGNTGSNSNPVSTVYFASIDNGQIGSWATTTPLPQALSLPIPAVVGDWLVVMGGLSAAGVYQSTMYYAAINPDGSLGSWLQGPNLSTAIGGYASGWDCAVADNIIMLLCGPDNSGLSGWMQTITVTEQGPADSWRQTAWRIATARQVATFTTAPGAYDIIALDFVSGYTEYSRLASVPMVSVPLYATGLTSGATYHLVLLPRQNATASDYLAIGIIDDTALPDPVLVSPRHQNTWNPLFGTDTIPIQVWDASATGVLRHTWEDSNSYAVAQATSTLLSDPVYQLPYGFIETALRPNVPRNSNPTFTSGVSPWTASGGTITQSAAQTQGGFPFSGLLTPSGSAATAIAASELFPAAPGKGPFYGYSQYYLIDGWLYSTPGYSSVSLSVAWYDYGGNLIATSSTVQALTAATWTHVQHWYQPPHTVAFGQIQVTESGTPASSAVLYLSNVQLVASSECVGATTSVAQIEYGSPPWPPTGVVQLN